MMKTEKLIALLESASDELGISAIGKDCRTAAKALRDELAQKNARKSGKADLYRAMKAVIKLATASNTALAGVIRQDGKQYVTDGHICIENAGTPIDLPELETEPMDAHKAMYSYWTKSDWRRCRMKLPTVAELKSGIALAKAEAKATPGCRKKPKVYYRSAINAFTPLLDAELLLIAVQAVGDNCEVWSDGRTYRDGKSISNLWLESSDGTTKVLLLPCRIDGEDFTGFTFR